MLTNAAHFCPVCPCCEAPERLPNGYDSQLAHGGPHGQARRCGVRALPALRCHGTISRRHDRLRGFAARSKGAQVTTNVAVASPPSSGDNPSVRATECANARGDSGRQSGSLRARAQILQLTRSSKIRSRRTPCLRSGRLPIARNAKNPVQRFQLDEM